MDEKKFKWEVKSTVDLKTVFILVNSIEEKSAVLRRLIASEFEISDVDTRAKTWNVIAYDDSPSRKCFRLMCTDGYDKGPLSGKKEMSFNEFNNLT